ncbi:MAG: septal ring lytic transglycosylase RlpA family protein [Parvularculaceae bacterium]|nr:septal ring lytic transglycosylase RlpA family protein [Parvularculaceae bacterium]
MAAPLLALAACSTVNLPDAPKTIRQAANPHYKIGAPYKIDGRWYVPKVDETYDETGVASWYGDAFHGKLTANGEIFDKRRLSAAHKTLPLPTIAEVENLENGRRIVVRVNDRGPFVDDRVIDLSHAAADELGFTGKGLARVRVRYVGEAEVTSLAALPGDKSAKPAATRVARTKPALSPQTVAADGEADHLGDLIASTTGQTRADVSLAAASAPAEMWVEIAQLDNLNALESMRLDPNLGPVTVQSAESGGRLWQSLRIGPFIDEAIAVASLSRVQAAGFGGARIIRSAGG